MGEAETRKFNETIYANINDSHKMITETLTSLVEAIDKELQVFEGLSVKADANIDDMQKAFDECRVQVGDVSETVDKAGKLAKKLAGLAMKSPSDLARPTIEKMLSEFAAADPEKWQAM